MRNFCFSLYFDQVTINMNTEQGTETGIGDAPETQVCKGQGLIGPVTGPDLRQGTSPMFLSFSRDSSKSYFVQPLCEKSKSAFNARDPLTGEFVPVRAQRTSFSN